MREGLVSAMVIAGGVDRYTPSCFYTRVAHNASFHNYTVSNLLLLLAATLLLQVLHS